LSQARRVLIRTKHPLSWQLITLSPEALSWAMLTLGFGGFGFAAFAMGMKAGQIAEAAWWKGKLQEARTSTREPPPRPATDLCLARRERRGDPSKRPM
jgi:hypothetical protein